MEKASIRRLERIDLQKWLPLWEGYNTFYKRIIPREVTHTTWTRFFDHYEPVNAFVAEHNQQLVGFVHYIFHRNTAMLGPTCYLQDLFTKSDARGQGIGRSLIEAVYAAAKVAEAPRVYWLTHETNAQGITLYEKVAERSGFIQYRKDIV